MMFLTTASAACGLRAVILTSLRAQLGRADRELGAADVVRGRGRSILLSVVQQVEPVGLLDLHLESAGAVSR